MALKHILEIALLISAIAPALARLNCSEIIRMKGDCRSGCCPPRPDLYIVPVIMIPLGIGLMSILTLVCLCLKERGYCVPSTSTGHVLVNRPLNVFAVSRTIQRAGEQPTTFAIFPSGYIPKTDTLAAEAPPAYSPQK
ncbi:hypothetical protein ACJMK2_016546 [Sinanodonta woodiana]|uniref:Uncharacterized protein n=1 Tax=Sinanodonta woodiana TaxID=1069815 RepID=A0ABD3UV97_SINWO